MADSQYVAGRRQQRHRRQTAASENLDWEPRRAESRHSVPYRTRQPEVQRPDRRRPKQSSHRSRASEDFLDTRSMPPVRLLTRATTPNPRGRRVFDHDDDDDDDENDDDSEKERLRGRMRSRSRSRPPGAWGGIKSRATSRAKSKVKSRPTSRGSPSTESITIPTPTRSSYVPMRSAPSAPSLGASSGSSSGDSDDDTDSTQDYREQTRTLKQRMNGTPDSEPAANPASRSRSRHKSRERIVPEIESPSEDSEDQVVSRHPRIIVKRSMSQHRRAHQSRSPSRAPPPQRRSHRRSEEDVSFPPKRAPKKYYHSDVDYAGKPSFSRSRATSTSRVTSHSMGSSSKQPLGNFFQTSALPQPYDKSSKVYACVACGDNISTKKSTKLRCGHRWCRSCLKRRFKISVEDAQNMPPTCCSSDIIPLKHVNDMFNDDFKRTWNEKYATFSARDRNHCPRPKCRALIRPEDLRHHSNGRTSATCRKCNIDICGVCYKKWHESKRCPTDADTAQFLKVAKAEGWQRCFKCQAMVELKEGCNHMTCRCGAQFCMICGSKWKACDCPSFNYEFNSEDDFNHVQIPVPMVSRERLGGTDGLPRGLHSSGLTYTHEPRRYRGHHDADRARRLQHPDEDDEDEDDDDEDDYLNDMGDMMGMGNATGHFMNGDYRRRSQSTIVPPAAPPAVPLPPASVTLERPNKSGANYVSGVNKARGVRGSSMERRLADRFSDQRQTQTFSPHHHRPFGQHVPPPTAPPMGLGMGMGPPLPHQAPMVPSPISRRHTMDDDMYDIPFDPRYAPPSLPRRATAHAYMDDFAVDAPLGRQRYRQMEPPRPSELAGLTGPGSGMNRVFEWRNHVDPYPPDSQTVA